MVYFDNLLVHKLQKTLLAFYYNLYLSGEYFFFSFACILTRANSAIE